MVTQVRTCDSSCAMTHTGLPLTVLLQSHDDISLERCYTPTAVPTCDIALTPPQQACKKLTCCTSVTLYYKVTQTGSKRRTLFGPGQARPFRTPAAHSMQQRMLTCLQSMVRHGPSRKNLGRAGGSVQGASRAPGTAGLGSVTAGSCIGARANPALKQMAGGTAACPAARRAVPEQ